jgi:cell wall-associated NlpC family hydrolase
MYNVGQEVTSLQPGELVFNNTSGRGVSHVGTNIGNGQLIHSASKNVKVDNMSSSYWKKRYIGAKRVNKIYPVIHFGWNWVFFVLQLSLFR